MANQSITKAKIYEYNGEVTVSSVNGIGKLERYTHKKKEAKPLSYTSKINSKYIKNLNVITEM